ncbi:unnamed protein product [Peronospora destructor]|uniref:Initiation factor eIF2 gamma C-terminal domain-containing protein n=1 Tax=Peronospora destructor TaxID=86335 RepID=A0AAV0TRQ7_9STRA|nr:unnamed protein product [Peronospora destructor]
MGLQNFKDRIKDDTALAQHEQIKKFVATTVAFDAPIILISPVFKYNVDVDVKNLKGSVAGGFTLEGMLRVGNEIHVRSGIVSKDEEGKMICVPIVSIRADKKNDLQFARLLGARNSGGQQGLEGAKLLKAEVLVVNSGSKAAGGKVLVVKQDLGKILLTVPVCTLGWATSPVH